MFTKSALSKSKEREAGILVAKFQSSSSYSTYSAGAAPTSAATHSIEFSGPQFEIEESCIAALFGWVQKAHAQDLRACKELKFMDLVFSFPFSFGFDLK